MVSREILIAAYIVAGLPLVWLSIRYNGIWVWPARMFIAEKTMLLLSIPAAGLLSRDLINGGFLIAFVVEFIILTGVVMRLRTQSKIIEVNKDSRVVSLPQGVDVELPKGAEEV
jgi:hypothetical protein